MTSNSNKKRVVKTMVLVSKVEKTLLLQTPATGALAYRFHRVLEKTCKM